MDPRFEEKLKILSGLNSVEFFIRSKAMDAVDYMSKIHPMIKLYFDSELSSEIENNALLAITEAIVKSVEGFTQKHLSHYRELGMSIAYHINKHLYFVKLIHHFNTNRISAEKFYDLAAEHFAVGTASIINGLWDVIGAKVPEVLCAGIEEVLTFIGIDRKVANYISNMIEGIFNVAYLYVKEHIINKERIKGFIQWIVEETVKAARGLMELTDTVINVSKEFYHNVVSTVKSWGRSVCEFFEWEIPDILKDEETQRADDKESIDEDESVDEDESIDEDESVEK